MKARTKLLGADGQVHHGDETLLDQWQAEHSGRLWLDIEGHLSTAMRENQGAGLSRPRHHRDRTRATATESTEFAENTFILFRGIIQLDDQLVLTPSRSACSLARITWLRSIAVNPSALTGCGGNNQWRPTGRAITPGS